MSIMLAFQFSVDILRQSVLPNVGIYRSSFGESQVTPIRSNASYLNHFDVFRG